MMGFWILFTIGCLAAGGRMLSRAVGLTGRSQRELEPGIKPISFVGLEQRRKGAAR